MQWDGFVRVREDRLASNPSAVRLEKNNHAILVKLVPIPTPHCVVGKEKILLSSW